MRRNLHCWVAGGALLWLSGCASVPTVRVVDQAGRPVEHIRAVGFERKPQRLVANKTSSDADGRMTLAFSPTTEWVQFRAPRYQSQIIPWGQLGGTVVLEAYGYTNADGLHSPAWYFGPPSPRDRYAYSIPAQLSAAAALQQLPPHEAVARLRTWTHFSDYNWQVLLLCAMLFTERDGSPLRPPSLGPARPLGGARATWRFAPLAFVDGAPFLIVERRNSNTGKDPYDEPSGRYLDYCLKEGIWTRQRFMPRDEEALRAALWKVMEWPLWNRALTEPEQRFLAGQVLPPPRLAQASLWRNN